METARHELSYEVVRHTLADFISGGDSGEEVLPGNVRRGLCRDQSGWDDADAAVHQHAVRVPLSSGVRHFRIGKPGCALSYLGAADPDRGSVARDRLFFDDELD